MPVEGFTKSKKKWGVRPEEMLVKYPDDMKKRLIREGRGLLEDPYDQIVPGLYPDEVVYELTGTDDQIAISVETYWQENGSGVSFHGYARLINDDGSTKTNVDGKPIEIGWQFTPDGRAMAQIVAEGHTVDEIASDVVRIMMGVEPLIQVDNVVDVDTGEVEKIPWIRPNDEGRMNANIKVQLDLMRQSERFPKLTI